MTTPLKIIHISDEHYAPKTLDKVEPCMAHVMAVARQEPPDVIVSTGDATDHAIDAHSPAFAALAKRVREASDIAPVLILQGTFSHSPRGLVDIYPMLAGKWPVYAAVHIHQVALLADNTWLPSNGFAFTSVPPTAKVIFTLFPTANKADVAAVVGASDASSAAGEAMQSLMHAFAPINQEARRLGIPCIALGHGTVSGCLTEHDVPMAGMDHEFSVGGLFALEASAVMLGHIHKHQTWQNDGRMIAYAGSLCRLHHGEIGDKGGVMWNVSPDLVTCEQIVTPTRRSVTIEFDTLPTAADIVARKAELIDCDVRIRWEVLEADRDKVDRHALEEALKQVGANEIKLEGTVIATQRSRAEGMNQLLSVDAKLGMWASTVGQNRQPLLERLDLLVSSNGEGLLDVIVEQCKQRAANPPPTVSGDASAVGIESIEPTKELQLA